MAHFTYYLRDYFTNSGYFPLSGTHYTQLLQCCFKHSSFVSFRHVNSAHPSVSHLEKWEVKSDDIVFDISDDAGKRSMYVACNDLHHAMLMWCDDLFSLHAYGEHPLPEDPIFFRKDGSVFFSSIIHEGECSLYPRTGESVEDVLSWGHWLYIGENGYPAVPAKEHQFPLPDYSEVQEDPLFQELIRIQCSPERYLPALTADAICDYVQKYRPPFLRNAKGLPPVFSCLPRWYVAFRMYVLGECDALTFTEIPMAFRNIKVEGEESFLYFYELLTQYVNLMRNSATR